VKLVEHLKRLAENDQVPRSRLIQCTRRLEVSLLKRQRSHDEFQPARPSKTPRVASPAEPGVGKAVSSPESIFLNEHDGLGEYGRVLTTKQTEGLVANLQALLPLVRSDIPAGSVDDRRFTFRQRGMSPVEWLKAVEGRCPAMYMLPNEHVFSNASIHRVALDSAMKNPPSDIPWAEKLFVRFAAAFQHHRASAKLGMAGIIARALYIASTEDESAHDATLNVDSSSFDQLHSCCENMTTAITNLRGFTNSKEISFASLACFMASSFRGVLFGPLQARYCPPTCAAQILQLLKTLVNNGVELPAEEFWVHTQALLHSRINEALETRAPLLPLPKSQLARTLALDFLQGWHSLGDCAIPWVYPRGCKGCKPPAWNLMNIVA